MKNIYLIVGKSGSGKSTAIEWLVKRRPEMSAVQSYTDRPKRYENETGHTFVTPEEFDKLNDMCAYVEYNGHRYCATTEQVNNSTFYIIDPKGLEYFKQCYTGPKNIVVIYLRLDLISRIKRIIHRGDGIIKCLSRIITDHFQFKYAEDYANYIVDSYELSHTVSCIDCIVTDEELFSCCN